MTRVPEGFDFKAFDEDVLTCNAALEPVIEILAHTDVDPALYVGCWDQTAAVYGETVARRLLAWLDKMHSVISEGMHHPER
jgi:hypothetical protein